VHLERKAHPFSVRLLICVPAAGMREAGVFRLYGMRKKLGRGKTYLGG
jgi:hypothetical protein